MGWTIKNSALAVGYSYPYAQKILSKYNQNGEKGVTNRQNKTSNHLRGKKRLLSQPQLEKLTRALANKPADGGIWTGTKVARWIEKETGREKVWNQRGWDYLKKCGYSWQSPRPAHKKADLLEQEILKANLPLKVEKLEQENPLLQIDLWFLGARSLAQRTDLGKRLSSITDTRATHIGAGSHPLFDEQRVGLKPILKKVWSKIGNRPEAIVQHRYEWLYVDGFVKPKTGETLWYLIPRVNTNWLNLVVRHFPRDAGINRQKKFSW